MGKVYSWATSIHKYVSTCVGGYSQELAIEQRPDRKPCSQRPLFPDLLLLMLHPVFKTEQTEVGMRLEPRLAVVAWRSQNSAATITARFLRHDEVESHRRRSLFRTRMIAMLSGLTMRGTGAYHLHTSFERTLLTRRA